MDVVEERWDPQSRTLSGKSHVVAGDRYELRISLPTSGEWSPKSATAGTQKLERQKKELAGVRVSYVPDDSGLVEWKVTF
jgi:hypothetical protein